ncbi:MAG TPA: Crp/Fnr family transcriptional regulator [Caulobacteraceae bacterium]|nr:Crp/Fnr family transcriptional regulator [Caulobacteraceae bacterium]
MKTAADIDPRAFLQINPWFAALPEAVQAALIEAGRRVSFAKDEWLFAEGDALGGLWAVLSGSLRMAVSVGPSRDVLFEIAGPGAILGHPVGFEGRPRLVTTRAGARTVMLAVPNAALLAISAAQPALVRALGELYHAHVSHILLVAAGALCLTPRAKVAGRLLLLAAGRLDGEPLAGVTQSDLAEMTGLSRKSANGHLQALQAKGMIQVEYGGVRIVDEAKLRAVAER